MQTHSDPHSPEPTKAPSIAGPPSHTEIERRREQRQREVVPEGLSRRQWKKQLKQQQWEETKDEYRASMREKKKLQRARKRERMQSDQEYRDQLPKIPKTQTPTHVKVIIDCEFDDLMTLKEVISMSNQIRSSYSTMRHCQYNIPIQVVSFNKRLKERYDTVLSDHKAWKGIDFTSESLAEMITSENKDQFVYLTADTEEEVHELVPSQTYIIGGIVDKNRHKNLCVEKARSLGLKVARLPIGKYIKINSREVLVTSHVYEICCRWFETRDWGAAFNKVLPPRKIVKNTEGEDRDVEQGKVPEEEGNSEKDP
ncbi:uncharacterized protein LODBEIA_P38210 [Lodderomyces beijingensis]|uniref:tRNA (guanine(9)-N1)-methyltransferase n=1 Tax=Lodderomyces beijingensis TaxID=1775926 RepID=A0ABP0ZN95_9ASCO